jgi:hypothetical protein
MAKSITNSGLVANTVDSFSTAAYRSGEYLVQVSNTTNFQSSKILILHDGTTASITEYGILSSNGLMGTLTASAAAGSVNLNFTALSAGAMTIKIVRDLIVA